MAVKKQSIKSTKARQSKSKKVLIKKSKKAAKVKAPKLTKIQKTKAARKVRLIKVRKQQTRNFKKAASILKKLGIAFQKKDIRKVKSVSKKDKGIIRKYKAVVSGKTVAKKLPKAELEKFRKAGYLTTKDKVILNKEEGTRYYTKRGRLAKSKIMKGGSIESIILPIPYKNLKQFLIDAKNDPSLEGLLPPATKWAFRFYGNNSLSTYDRLEHMMDTLLHYETVYTSINARNAREMMDVYNHLEIVTVKNITMWEGDASTRDTYVGGFKRYRKRKVSSEYKRSYYQRTKMRNPSRYNEMLKQKEKNNKKWYEKNKNNKAFKEKRAAKERKRYNAGKK